MPRKRPGFESDAQRRAVMAIIGQARRRLRPGKTDVILFHAAPRSVRSRIRKSGLRARSELEGMYSEFEEYGVGRQVHRGVYLTPDPIHAYGTISGWKASGSHRPNLPKAARGGSIIRELRDLDKRTKPPLYEKKKHGVKTLTAKRWYGPWTYGGWDKPSYHTYEDALEASQQADIESRHSGLMSGLYRARGLDVYAVKAPLSKVVKGTKRAGGRWDIQAKLHELHAKEKKLKGSKAYATARKKLLKGAVQRFKNREVREMVHYGDVPKGSIYRVPMQSIFKAGATYRWGSPAHQYEKRRESTWRRMRNYQPWYAPPGSKYVTTEFDYKDLPTTLSEESGGRYKRVSPSKDKTVYEPDHFNLGTLKDIYQSVSRRRTRAYTLRAESVKKAKHLRKQLVSTRLPSNRKGALRSQLAEELKLQKELTQLLKSFPKGRVRDRYRKAKKRIVYATSLTDK